MISPGVGLFVLVLFVEGLVLLILAARGVTYQQIPEADRIPYRPPMLGQETQTADRAVVLAFGLALVLRLTGLSQSFWIDEVVTLGHAANSVWDQLTQFTSPNNHLLNSVLIKASLAIFGESEWSARLPAMLFGTATIPVLYWVSRDSIGAWPAAAASLLLCVSYHHIFFSQNARGYSAYLFLSLLATGLLLRGFRKDEFVVWVLYIAVMLLNFLALMNAVFVFVAHLLVAAFALYTLWRSPAQTWPAVRRLLFVFLALGLLVLNFYAIKVPQIYSVLSELYADQATGFSFFSKEFFREFVSGVSAGFGSGALIAALPFLLVAVMGFIRLLKQDRFLTSLLLLPGVVVALYLIARSLTVSPRFFLFEIFLALLCAVCGAVTVVNALVNRVRAFTPYRGWLSVSAVALIAVLSMISLIQYYKTPKQPYRAAVSYLESTRSDFSRVLVIYTAASGIAYYLERSGGPRDDLDYVYLRDTEQFFREVSADGKDAVYVVTTFHRALGIVLPEILRELQDSWKIDKQFPATIGDGEITIWVSN